MEVYLIFTAIVSLLVGYNFGVKAGFNYADNNWFQHLEKHGWKMVADPSDPNGPGIPTQKYGDHWYNRNQGDS